MREHETVCDDSIRVYSSVYCTAIRVQPFAQHAVLLRAAEIPFSPCGLCGCHGQCRFVIRHAFRLERGRIEGSRHMAEKLNTGDMFPSMTLNLVDGGTLNLPGGIESKYKVILFYRGHW
jgi:hypothetical protein